MADREESVELYTDYLIVVNGQAIPPGLSAVLDDEMSCPHGGQDTYKESIAELEELINRDLSSWREVR